MNPHKEGESLVQGYLINAKQNIVLNVHTHADNFSGSLSWYALNSEAPLISAKWDTVLKYIPTHMLIMMSFHVASHSMH